MLDGSERWLRPDARPLLRLCVLLVGGVWLFLAGLTAYAAVWWPDHGILKNTVAEWFGGMAAYGVILATPFAISWLANCPVAWRVGPEGVAVYHGTKLRRSFGWAEVVSLQVLPCAIIVRLAIRPFEERLQWPQKDGAEWLREFARERLGDRIGA
jgi:hypothetical protein